MRKFISGIIILLLFNVNYSYASYFANVLNESVTDTLDVYHLVDRESIFKISFFRNIVDAGDTDVADFRIVNNTVDGFQLLISSLNGGVFVPSTTLDGETDIPYSIDITYSGILGTNVTSVTSVSSATMGASNSTQLLAVDYQISPTDVEGIITVKISDDNNQFMMAGSYSDTITITYVDN